MEWNWRYERRFNVTVPSKISLVDLHNLLNLPRGHLRKLGSHIMLNTGQSCNTSAAPTISLPPFILLKWDLHSRDQKNLLKNLPFTLKWFSLTSIWPRECGISMLSIYPSYNINLILKSFAGLIFMKVVHWTTSEAVVG